MKLRILKPLVPDLVREARREIVVLRVLFLLMAAVAIFCVYQLHRQAEYWNQQNIIYRP